MDQPCPVVLHRFTLFVMEYDAVAMDIWSVLPPFGPCNLTRGLPCVAFVSGNTSTS